MSTRPIRITAAPARSFLGRALKDGYRERVKLATKLPCWLVKEREDFDRHLDEQLARLQTGKSTSTCCTRWTPHAGVRSATSACSTGPRRALADGRIGHLGFSFHDTYETFQEIVDAYDGWTFCQIQYNYLDEENQAGTRGLEYAADKGLGVVVMEPLRGGLLAGNAGQRQGQGLPPSIQALWDSAPVRRSPAEWAFQWLWQQPAISLVLSGMSTLAQVEENIISANRSRPGLLTSDELALVGQVRDEYRASQPDPLHRLQVLPAVPKRRRHPGRLRHLQRGDDVQRAGARAAIAYANWVAEAERGDQLPGVRRVRNQVPAGIAIIEWLEKADRYLTAV